MHERDASMVMTMMVFTFGEQACKHARKPNLRPGVRTLRSHKAQTRTHAPASQNREQQRGPPHEAGEAPPRQRSRHGPQDNIRTGRGQKRAPINKKDHRAQARHTNCHGQKPKAGHTKPGQCRQAFRGKCSCAHHHSSNFRLITDAFFNVKVNVFF